MKIIGSNNAVRTPEFDKKKKQERIIRVSLIVLGILLLVGLPIYLSRLDNLQISNIELQGNEVTNDEEIQAIVSDELDGKYVWLFPKSNAFLYPENKLEARLLADIPRLATADVSLENNRSLLVSVTERDPLALYCRVVDAKSFDDCYFLDEVGYIFSRAPSFSPGVYTVYGSEPALENPLGMEYLPAEEFNKVHTFTQELVKLPIRYSALVTTEGEYHALLSDGGIIKLKSSEDLQTSFSNLESFIGDDAFKDEPDALARLLYIDLRFGNKIFYKFR